MTNLDEMWQELAEYQPYADKHGFGYAWLPMTTERTEKAAHVAAAAAARNAARAAARAATEAAACAAWDAAAAEDAASAEWVQLAIDCIRKAIEKEQT